MTGKNILATGLGNHCSQFGDLEGAQQGIETPNQPDTEKQPNIWKQCGDRARCAKDAGADCVTDDDGKAKANAEDAQQAPAGYCW